MSVFTNHFVTRWHSESDEWEVVEDFEFHSGERDSGLFIRCCAGMRTDLASIPRGFRWLIRRVGRDAQGACVHDRGYRDGFMIARVGGAEKRIPVSRGMVDSMYYQAMLALGTSPIRRELIYRGLKTGGWVVWNRYRRSGGVTTETTR